MTLSVPAFAQNQAALCKLWFTHKDGPAQSAAYQPGVDVNGNPVTPADLNAPVTPLSNAVRIPVTLDLAQLLGQNVKLPAGTELKTEAGMVEIHANGRVMYDGQDITDETLKLCLGDDAAKLAEEKKQKPEPAAPPEETGPQPAVVTDPPSKDEQIIWGEGF